MSEHLHAPVSDSPWFWVMLFALMAVGAIVAIGGKYGRRQAGIERQFQARQRINEQQADGNNRANAARTTSEKETASRREFSQPGETLVPLWPLAALLVLIALFAAGMLWRSRRQTAPL